MGAAFPRLLRSVVLRLVLGGLLFGLGCGVFLQPPTPTPGPPPDQLQQRVREVWEVLQRVYVAPEQLDPKVLADGAARGMVETLNDPYTVFLDAEHYQVRLEDLSGAFDGIGAVVGNRGGKVVIVSPMKGTPAEEAGLRAGDVILAVDGQLTNAMDVAAVVARVRGPSGQPVRLRIQRDEAGEPLDVSIVRRRIEIPAVTMATLPGSFAHIVISHFSENTDRDLEQELKRLKAQGLRGIVLDLRNNPGGFLHTAINVASQFLPKGVVLYEVSRSGAEETHDAQPGGQATRTLVVVLVNGGSASASEVVAAALRDNNRARLVGEQTFGKGSVNLLQRLSDGAGLYVTTARWLTPSRQQIEGRGLAPDILVADDPGTAMDEQLAAAVRELAASK
ncbi:MAG: S41 family peptidase [Chloroflexi bacterium]|nr:S41 family peptidase [Chloroflexota bacterium]